MTTSRPSSRPMAAGALPTRTARLTDAFQRRALRSSGDSPLAPCTGFFSPIIRARMTHALRTYITTAALILWMGGAIAQLEHISRTEATGALRAALEKGSQAAVATLGRTDGFLGDARVRIPLPESAQRAAKPL